MKFCPECGTGHECTAVTASTPNPDVEIARINAERDKYIARVQSSQARAELETAEEIAETQAEAEVDAATAEAVIVGAALEAGVAEPADEPIVIDAPAIEVDQDDDAEQLPPAEGSPVPAPSKRVGLGMW